MNRRQILRGSALVAIGARPAAAQTRAAPLSDFGPRATAEAVTAGIDLGGKTALITGCNSGLGYETMRVRCRNARESTGSRSTSSSIISGISYSSIGSSSS